MGTSHTSRPPGAGSQQVDQILEPLHGWVEGSTNGEHSVRPGACYVSKIQVNGNLFYGAAPTTTIYVYYQDDDVAPMVLYGPLYIKTVDVSIGVTLHMATLLGQDLKVPAGKNGRIYLVVTNANTSFRMDVWGWRYKAA